jgi:hypothetical protein
MSRTGSAISHAEDVEGGRSRVRSTSVGGIFWNELDDTIRLNTGTENGSYRFVWERYGSVKAEGSRKGVAGGASESI